MWGGGGEESQTPQHSLSTPHMADISLPQVIFKATLQDRWQLPFKDKGKRSSLGTGYLQLLEECLSPIWFFIMLHCNYLVYLLR